MIQLAYFEKDDFDQLINWIDTEELLMMWSGRMFSFPLTEESLEWYISDTNNLQTSDAFIYKAIDEDREVVDHICLGGISRTNKSGRISRVFVSNEGKRNRGICKQMVEAVLEVGFTQLGLHRIGLGVYTNNLSALKCYVGSGFKEEGIQRDVFLYNGIYWSMLEMSILEDEWKERHKKS